MNIKDSEIKQLLNEYKKITVVGLSPDAEKASHYVPLYMREQGWDIVGVYPKAHSAAGFKIYSTLKDVPEDYKKFVNVFRSSDKIPDVVEDALAVGGVETIWLQLGIHNSDAEKTAEEHGMKVVSDRCLIIEHKKWFR
jgi:uncharacterized protein